VGRYGAQVCIDAHRGPHFEQALFGAHESVGTAPLWSANRAQQNCIGVGAQLPGGGWERGAHRVDGGSTDQASLKLEAMAVATADSREDPDCLRRDLWSYAIPGEDADQGFHGRTFSKRVMASA
jgi:hypothetical protein